MYRRLTMNVKRIALLPGLVALLASGFAIADRDVPDQAESTKLNRGVVGLVRLAAWSILALAMTFPAMGHAQTPNTIGFSDTPARCTLGETMSVFQAAITGFYSVDEFVLDGEGGVTWIRTGGGGLGKGVEQCYFLLFAGSASYLPDEYSFCARDVFLGGNSVWIGFTDPDARAYLDEYYSDIKGSYQQKAIADLDLFSETVELTRLTYYDESGTERPVGDGGSNDPASADPTAGDPKPQQVFSTGYKISKNYTGAPVVYRDDGVFLQLEAGQYVETTHESWDGSTEELGPIQLNIVPCD